MFFLFTQISLAYTVVHINKGWIVFLESFVGIHAFVVATATLSQAVTGIWVMFTTGFAFMFVFTAMLREITRSVTMRGQHLGSIMSSPGSISPVRYPGSRNWG